jgi:hypothetical protein
VRSSIYRTGRVALRLRLTRARLTISTCVQSGLTVTLRSRVNDCEVCLGIRVEFQRKKPHVLVSVTWLVVSFLTEAMACEVRVRVHVSNRSCRRLLGIDKLLYLIVEPEREIVHLLAAIFSQR